MQIYSYRPRIKSSKGFGRFRKNAPRLLVLKGLLIILPLFFACSSIGKKGSNDEYTDTFFEDHHSANESERSNEKVQEQRESEVGYAAWYGKELHGKPTASGQIFNMNRFTAAHRTLPMGSKIMVTNLSNYKKKIVRVNDRGPYVEGRVIDVSYAVARDLGFAEKGIARVRVDILEKAEFSFLSKVDPSKPGYSHKSYTFADGRKPDGYTIQVGAFISRQNAEEYRNEIESQFNYRSFIASRGKWHFVWMGNLDSSEKAKRLMRKLQREGFDTVYRGKIF